MTTEPKRFFGVSTPALMPDDPDLDMSSAQPDAGSSYVRATQPAGDGYRAVLSPSEAPASSDLRPCMHDPLGRHPDRLCTCEKTWPEKPPVLTAPSKYASLENVLHRALEQASAGKGAERHASGQAFEDQPMQTISRLVGSHHGLLYQAIKKAQESARLPTAERQVAELLGAINYLAGAVIYLESPK